MKKYLIASNKTAESSHPDDLFQSRLKVLLAVLQNFTVTDQIQKVAEAFQCKPVEGNLNICILYDCPSFTVLLQLFIQLYIPLKLKQNGCHLLIHRNNSNCRLQLSNGYCNQGNIIIILNVNLSLTARYKRIMAKGGWNDDFKFFYNCLNVKKGEQRLMSFL